mmetsp:Transcript_19939/g.29037  ORF Transcript_19939/g.29037 Transcript_19939/m.29037 type:complete len:85 (+) Transcript_19939:240-494(+)
MELIKAKFPVKELGEVRNLLGVRLSHEREHGKIRLSQPGLAKLTSDEAGVWRFASTLRETRRVRMKAGKFKTRRICAQDERHLS